MCIFVLPLMSKNTAIFFMMWMH